VRDAEPQVSESINSMEKKTETMKTYILRDLKAVEPQKTAHPARFQPTSAPAPGPYQQKWQSTPGAGRCARRLPEKKTQKLLKKKRNETLHLTPDS